MEKLVELRCVPYRDGELPLTAAEVSRFADQVPDWLVVEREGIKRLERCFKFDNYAAALAFTNRVGAIAEAENHHPALLTEWGRVTVTWWTHAVRGLHRNDLVMAAKTDGVYTMG